MKITPRFENALVYACQLHAHQKRKGSGAPYASHLLGVTALVMEDGGSEDEAIAALLHDAAEDQGGRETLDEIGKRFGPQVSKIVRELSDTLESPKPPWRERKKAYLAHLPTASESVLRVSLADKLHNARSIILDYYRVGDQIWDRFHGHKSGTLWYYRALADIFNECSDSSMVPEFEAIVRRMETLD